VLACRSCLATAGYNLALADRSAGKPRVEGAHQLSHSGTASTLLRGLFDDASLFPPAAMPMSDALDGHVRHQTAWYRELSGAFVCPESRLTQLRAALTAVNLAEIDLSLIVTGGAAGVAEAVDAVAIDPRLRLRSVEVPAGLGPATRQDRAAAAQPVAEVAAALDAVPLAGAAGYVEIPLTALGDDVLAPIEAHRYRAKLRTGGQTAAAFPDEAALAACLVALADRRLPFKCTAGLHHAVRHTAADTGFEHHGFLNLLLAVTAAADGAAAEDVAAVLADRDGGQVAAQIAGLDLQDAGRARDLVTSIGSCSTDEPVADLVALGLLSEAG
jgi:hypothetical protein